MLKHVQPLMDTLNAMKDLERAMAEFYRCCGEVWPEEQEFWLELERQENQHFQNIERIEAMVSQNPEQFDVGRPLNAATTRVVIGGMQKHTALLRSGALDKRKALVIARDAEQSVLEAKYGELVKTANPEYQTLMACMVSQTTEHHALIHKMITGEA